MPDLWLAYITLQWRMQVTMYTALKRTHEGGHWLKYCHGVISNSSIRKDIVLLNYFLHKLLLTLQRKPEEKNTLLPAKSWTNHHSHRSVFSILQTVILIYCNREVVCHSLISYDFVSSQETFILIIPFVYHLCTVLKIYSLQLAVNYSLVLFYGIFMV